MWKTQRTSGRSKKCCKVSYYARTCLLRMQLIPVYWTPHVRVPSRELLVQFIQVAGERIMRLTYSTYAHWLRESECWSVRIALQKALLLTSSLVPLLRRNRVYSLGTWLLLPMHFDARARSNITYGTAKALAYYDNNGKMSIKYLSNALPLYKLPMSDNNDKNSATCTRCSLQRKLELPWCAWDVWSVELY